MLSTEATPPDLPCPCVISQQKNNCSSNIFSIDERDSSDNNNEQQLEVDLFKSGLDDDNPLPKFSIRNYVSSARGKDIKTNWPFSQKNLQLCLKHGVADVLPPFQSLDIVRKPESSAPASRKIETSTQNSVKNCKLIVKLSKIPEPLSIEHSESMASKVCPVCKTFSSSSNTTLNAHIDQCLSVVSTVDCTSNSKVSKHRIKPRKTRSMVDIYATALHCTLEDLDRRNGTNWASNMVFLTRDLEACAKEKKKKIGDVYVDSSGTKFLSLSKCGDLPFNSNGKDDCAKGKLVGMNEESRFPLRKTRKVLVKRHKSLNHSHCGRASSSPGPSQCPEVNNVQQTKLFHEDGSEEEVTAQPVKAYDQMISDEMGKVNQCVVGSTRTGFRKISREEHQLPDKTIKNLIVKDSLAARGDSHMKGTSDSNSPVFSYDNHLVPSECKRKVHLRYTSHNESIKPPSLRKRAGLSVMTSRDCHGKSNKRNEINANTALNAECSSRKSRISHQHTFSCGGEDLAYSRQPPLGHVISPGHKKNSFLRKKLSATHASVPESKDNSESRHLNFKKPRQHYSSDFEAVPQSAICRRDNQVEKQSVNAAQMEKTSVQSSMELAKVLKIRKKGIFLNSCEEVDISSMGSEISPESDSHGAIKNIDYLMGVGVPTSTSNDLDAVRETEIQDEFVCELISPAFLLLGGEPQMFYADRVAENMTRMAGEMDVNVGQGNSFVDVDPIQIPGPPGSFLPSPGRMSSEELPGNSSLTNCRIQSPEDKNELMDVDSSDSPISSASVISESAAGVLRLLQTPAGKVPTPNAEKCRSNSQMGYAPMLLYQNSETKFPTCDDCESPSPSTTNPVLRLMGKNLMVVNKDETLSPQMRQTHLSMVKDSHPNMLSNVDNGVYSIQQTLSQVPSILDHMQPSMLAQHLDASSSNCFENTGKIRIQRSAPHPSEFMLSSKSFGGSLASSFEHNEFASGSNQTSEYRIQYRTPYRHNIWC